MNIKQEILTIGGADSQAMFIVLMNDGFLSVFQDEEMIVMSDPFHRINIYIELQGDLIKTLYCTTRFIKFYIPLTLAKLQIFVAISRFMSAGTYTLN